MRQAPPSGSGERLIHVIKLIASGPHSFSLGEFATRAMLPASSVHRLLKTLEKTGLVERGSGQTYRPGRELHRIGSQLVSRFDLARSARPLLRDLVERFQETAVLSAYSPTVRRAVVAEVALSPKPLRFNVDKGLEVALPWGSLGRSVLAFMPPSEIEMVLRSERSGPLTGIARPPRGQLEAELSSIRERGYARYCEPEIDLAGIAAPVFNAEGEILGSIGVIMPSSRFSARLEDDLAPAIKASAENLSEQAAISHS